MPALSRWLKMERLGEGDDDLPRVFLCDAIDSSNPTRPLRHIPEFPTNSD